MSSKGHKCYNTYYLPCLSKNHERAGNMGQKISKHKFEFWIKTMLSMHEDSVIVVWIPVDGW